MERFAKDIVLFLLRSNLFVKYNQNLCGSLVLLFSVFINIISILYILSSSNYRLFLTYF